MRGGRWVHSLEADERPTVVDLSAPLEEEEERTPATGETSTDESDVVAPKYPPRTAESAVSREVADRLPPAGGVVSAAGFSGDDDDAPIAGGLE